MTARISSGSALMTMSLLVRAMLAIVVGPYCTPGGVLTLRVTCRT
jgi:hypothetical protein